jgi:hypothetical protein
MGDVVPVPVRPPGELVTVYVVIEAPPSEAGGVNATLACPGVEDVATGAVGASGRLAGIVTPNVLP